MQTAPADFAGDIRRMPSPAAPLGPHSAFLIGAAAVFAALLFGVVGGFFGFEVQALLFAVLVPATLLVVSPRAGLLLYILIVPFNNSTLLPRQIQNIVFFGIGALFFARLALHFLAGKRINLPVPRELWAYIAVMVLATAIGYTHLDEITPYFLAISRLEKYGFKEYVIGFFAKQMTLVVMAGMIVWLIVNRVGDGKWIMKAAIASGVVFVMMMFALFAAKGFPVERLRNDRNLFIELGRQSNSAGGMLFIIMACSLYMWELTKGGWSKLVLAATTATLFVGVLMTVSRGAIVGMLVVLLVYAVEFRRIRSAFTVALLMVAMFAIAPTEIQERLFQGLDTRSVTQSIQGPGDEITSGRVDIWRNLAPEVLEAPIFGQGLLSSAWSRYSQIGGYFAFHPHSMYLGILMDIGLVGLIVMIVFWRYLWKTFRSLAADERLSLLERGFFRGSAAALLGYLVFGIPGGAAQPMPDQAFLWVAIGLAIGYRARYGPLPVAAAVPKRRAYHRAFRSYGPGR
jgi:O-antigen ligase